MLAWPLWADERAEVDALNQQMMTLYGQGRYAEATPLAKQVAQRLERALGPDSLDVASSLNNLAELYAKQKLFADAEPLYRRSLMIREHVLGKTHPDSVKSRTRLAELLRSQGRDAEATALLEPPPPPHPPAGPANEAQMAAQIAAMNAANKAAAATAAAAQERQAALQQAQQLNQRVVDLMRQERLSEAVQPAEQMLAIFEKYLPPDHPNRAVALSNLAQIDTRLERYYQAEPLFKRSLAILEKAPATRAADLGMGLNNLAELYARQHRFSEAEPLLKRAIGLLDKKMSKDDPGLNQVLFNLAQIEQMQHEDPEADPLLKGRMAGFAKIERPLALPAAWALPATPDTRPPPASEDVDRAKALEQQMFQLSRQGRYEEALPIATQLQSLTETLYGGDSLALALVLDSVVAIDKALGRDQEAKDLARRAQMIRDQMRRTDHSGVKTQP